MSPEISLKLKALMIIAMLAVAEGRRVKTDLDIAEAFELRSSSSSHGARNNETNQASEVLDAPSDCPLDLDMLLKDPAFHKQLEAMAEHMDSFADQMKAKPRLLARAKEIGKEMFSLSAFPTYEDMVKENAYADSKLPSQMEAMIADPEFQQQAQLFAESMQKFVAPDADLQEQFEMSAESIESAQESSDVVAEQLIEKFADPSFQQQQEQVSRVLHSLMSDPDLQKEAESIAAYLEQVRTPDPYSDAGSDIAQEVSERVDAVLATPKFREKASEVVLTMLSAGLPEDPNEWKEDEWLEGVDLDELAKTVENPSPELAKAMEEVRKAKAKQASLLQMKQTSEKEKVEFAPLTPPALIPRMGGFARAPVVGRPAGPIIGSQGTPGTPRWPGSWRSGAEFPRSAVRVGDPKMDMTSDGDSWYDGIDNPAPMQSESGGDTTVQPLTSATGIRSMMPSLVKALPRRVKGAVMSAGEKGKGVDVALLLCFGLWYLGNYYYNISNKIALTAAGGAAGFPMTIATLQLGVGVIYALFMWLAPDARKRPDISFKDYVSTLPVGAMSAGAHAASVFALGAGSVSFAQIVKASEPAFAAVIGTLAYGSRLSKAKWLSLIPVIGGVCLASLGELNFAVGALITASIANVFAAIKGNENAKLMSAPGLSDRIGSVGNQFAITTINAFLFTLPLMLLTEGARLGQFLTLLKTSPLLLNNLIGSGLWFYLYNELATLTIKKTDAVTASVANTAKRVIVIVVVALAMKESLTPLKLIGSGIGISGVLLYSIIDKLVEARKAKRQAKAADC